MKTVERVLLGVWIATSPIDDAVTEVAETDEALQSVDRIVGIGGKPNVELHRRFSIAVADLGVNFTSATLEDMVHIEETKVMHLPKLRWIPSQPAPALFLPAGNDRCDSSLLLLQEG